MTYITNHTTSPFKNLWRDISANPLSYIITLFVAIFLIAQPIKKSVATDVSIVLWILGLIVLISGKVKIRALVPYRKTILAGFAFFLVALISLLLSDYPADLQTLEPEFRLLLLPLIIAGIYFSGLRAPQLIFALLLGGISYAWVTHDQLGGFKIVRRVFGDENSVGFGNGAFLLTTISAYFCLSFWKSSKIFAMTAAITAILYLYAAIASGTRGSFLAVPVIFLFFIIHFRSVKVIFASLAIGTLLSVIIYQTPLQSGIDRAVKNLTSYVQGSGNNLSSTGLRLKQWEAAICMAKKKPVFGVGSHQFRPASQNPNLGCDFNSEGRKRYFVQAHSLYFNTLATMGLTGLACLLAFGFSLCRESLNVRPDFPHKYAVVIITLTIAGYSLTVDGFFIRFIAEKHLTLLGVMLGIMLHGQQKAALQR
ncbi:O-antigen ligase family protein [Thalassolituus alkanivorans]|uniref:O-antigen ligase family protein n=1 Tax=Thalassolituus alkanivorans TaxID=2881055 RepID=UPI001E2CFFDA|nr:O-antigen ligase family protein [Thalassolituus alkanivorans]MCB2386077.1 O-antigen ligase family protein [Thalassolituus alkanivorans]MCB2423065.1 O-antigen ligase family protein [Thalassolituus alkanivorans]